MEGGEGEREVLRKRERDTDRETERRDRTYTCFITVAMNGV